MEKEEYKKISFLDVAVTRKNGIFTTEVFRKLTHTDLYTHYTSHSVKAGTLDLRANICDGESKEELKHLRDTFKWNGYPKEIIERNVRETIPTIREEEGV